MSFLENQGDWIEVTTSGGAFQVQTDTWAVSGAEREYRYRPLNLAGEGVGQWRFGLPTVQQEADQLALRARGALTSSEKFLADEQRYYAHMERFMMAHRNAPHRDALCELERTESWEKIMGAEVAGVLAAPTLSMIEDAMKKRGLGFAL